MRYILIDLSSDNYLQQPNLFGGYEGEHNETILQVKLPKRMIDIECSGYRFDFQTSEDNKISSPLIPVSELNNDILSFHLTQQLTISGKLLFNVVAILSDENTVSLISKTNTVVLHIENAADGNIQLLDPNGYKDELQKMVDERIAEINPAKVDQTYIPDSEKAQSGKAVTEAIAIEQKRANNTFANALKGNASGTTITIDDVSPVTHKMSVKISSNTVTDLAAVKVSRCGKNIVPTVDSGIYYSGSAAQGKPYIPTSPTVLTSTQNINLSSAGKRGVYAVIKLIEGETYTLSFKNLVNNCATPAFKYCVGFRTNESDLFGQSQIDNAVVSNSNPTSFTFTVPSGSPYCLVGGYNYPNVAGDTISFEAMQIEVGSVATDFQNYISTTYIPNADGTVEGVTSLYPTTTLSTDTDGVIINCEYNRDINKAFAELTQAIISLGGNV